MGKMPICPKCEKPVNTRISYVRPTGRAIPKGYPKGTYHFDCYARLVGLPTPGEVAAEIAAQ
jgi:hypothetical protein